MKYKGKAAIAAYILNVCKDGETLTTDDMRRIFDLNEWEMQRVKVAARKIAVKWALFWSYDPEIRAYRVCPTGDRETADRMAAYAVRTAGGALYCASLAIDGQFAARLAGRKETVLRREALSAMMTDIETMAQEIES